MILRLAPLLALAACAGDPAPGGSASDAEPAGSAPGLVAVRLDPRDEGCEAGAGGALRCAGPGGWAVHLADDGGRAVLTLVDADGTEHPVDAAGATGHAGASRIRDHAEWWTVGRGRRTAPTALVVTHVAVRPDGPRNSAGERLDLLVVKVGGEVCVVARIPSFAGARAEARELAAATESRSCGEDAAAP